MTNGHCLRKMAPGEVVVHGATKRVFTLFNAREVPVSQAFKAREIAYATMTNLDVGIYELNADKMEAPEE